MKYPGLNSKIAITINGTINILMLVYMDEAGDKGNQSEDKQTRWQMDLPRHKVVPQTTIVGLYTNMVLNIGW